MVIISTAGLQGISIFSLVLSLATRGPEGGTSRAESYLKDILALDKVTVEVAGRPQLKQQLRNPTPLGLFVPLHQERFSEL